MSLFKCSMCGGIENTACCWDSKKEIVFDLSENNKFPNMGLMDMQGHGDEFKINGVVWKAKDEIMMLCSECNTGIWHGEWTKEYSTVEEDIVASYSKYGFIQPYDHEELSILTLEVNGKISYKVNEVYKNFYSIFKQAYNINNNSSLIN